ncbi:MAG TPA: SRPBCC family protein [Caulobacteraceae bacterium]
MTETLIKRTAVHATFCIERTLDASPARVFKAFADPKAKAIWFGGEETWTRGDAQMDFRVGGRERNTGKHGDVTYTFDALYWEIIPNERIIYSYEMHLNGQKISVSQTTIELAPEGKRTKLTFTEQGVFLDGFDDPKLRENGTKELMDALEASLKAAV